MSDLLKDADICVKCGLCLPTCPTYSKTQNENESPRGRIALIQAWEGGYLSDSKTVREHIDNCLLCRECERICPAVVPYSRLIDNFRSQFYGENSPTLAFTVLKKVTQHKEAQWLIQSTLKLYQTTPLQNIARSLKLPSLLRLNKIERLLSHYHEAIPLAEYYSASAESKGTVGLFEKILGWGIMHVNVEVIRKQKFYQAQRIVFAGFFPNGKRDATRVFFPVYTIWTNFFVTGQNLHVFAR